MITRPTRSAAHPGGHGGRHRRSGPPWRRPEVSAGRWTEPLPPCSCAAREGGARRGGAPPSAEQPNRGRRCRVSQHACQQRPGLRSARARAQGQAQGQVQVQAQGLVAGVPGGDALRAGEHVRLRLHHRLARIARQDGPRHEDLRACESQGPAAAIVSKGRTERAAHVGSSAGRQQRG